MLLPPDSYVKVHLLDGSKKRLQKRKSGLCKASFTPSYEQVLLFVPHFQTKVVCISVLAREKFGRRLLLGEAQVNLASLDLTVRLTAWYRLFFSHPCIASSQ